MSGGTKHIRRKWRKKVEGPAKTPGPDRCWQWAYSLARGYFGPGQKRLLKVLERDNFVCWLCGDKIYDPRTDLVNLNDMNCPTLDHIKPVCKGGTDALTNLRAAHSICNCLRGDGEGL